MGKIKVAPIFEGLKRTFIKRSPEILIGVGIAGFIFAGVLAVKATPKAMELLDDNDCGISTIKHCLDSSQLLDVGGSDVYTGAPYRKDIFNKFYGLLKGFDSSASIFNRLL